MANAVEPYIFTIDAGENVPAGYQVVVHVRDQWDDRRKTGGTFRPIDESLEAKEEALQRARECRDEILANRDKIDWLRAEFPNPRERREFNGTKDLFDHGAKFYERDRSHQNLQDYVELGLKVDQELRYSIDPSTEKRGYLRRILEDTSKSNFHKNRAAWVAAKRWGGIGQKRLKELEGEDVDNFVRFLERQTGDDGKPRYSKSTIKGYRQKLCSMIKGFAQSQAEVNPLDISPPRRKPTRFKGKPPQRKVLTEEEMESFEKGFGLHVEKATEEGSIHHKHLPRRQWAYHVHRVLRHTGMRPSEALYLETKHVDREGKRIMIEGGTVERQPGFTKTGKQKGDREAGARVIPVENCVIKAIEDWLRIRESLGFPSPDKAPIIFCDEAGKYATAGSLRNHYKAACSAVDDDVDVTPYQMRHWRNDLLRRKGMPSEVRQELLGHIEEETNLNYTNVRAEEARRWFDGG